MVNVIIIRPISESWEGELYKRALSIPHGPLALSAHLIDKGLDPLIIDEIALTETIQTQISERAVNILKSELKKKKPICVGITSMTGEQIRRGKLFAKMVREFDGTIPIVWGGSTSIFTSRKRNDAATHSNLKINIQGIDPMANFKIKNSNWLVTLTFFIQEMLKKGILASDKCYANYKHSPKLLKKYESACFQIFERIAKLEKSNKLKKSLDGPVKQMDFKRLTN